MSDPPSAQLLLRVKATESVGGHDERQQSW